MNIKLNIKFIIIITVIKFILSPQPAFSQEVQRTITIIPPIISLTVNPGDNLSGDLKVINASSVPLNFSAQAQDFIVQDTNGTPDFISNDTLNKPWSAKSWIQIIPNTFTLNPAEKETLNYFLQIPSNARPGGHYAAVLYTPSLAGTIHNTGPAVQTKVGTLFSIDVSGQITEQAFVSKFIPEHTFYEYGPVNIIARIENRGDLHIKPIGNITIYDIFGRKLATLLLTEHNIFPLSARDYVNIFGQHWMIGRFTAKLSAHYARFNNLSLLASTTFWVFPWKIAIVVLLIIIAIILGVLLFIKKENDRSENKP